MHKSALLHRASWYLRWVRTFPCIVCGNGDVHAHHVQVCNPNGIGTKPSDFRTLPLCPYHHNDLHMTGERRFWEYWDQNPLILIAAQLMRWADDHPDGNVREGMLHTMETVIIGAKE